MQRIAGEGGAGTGVGDYILTALMNLHPINIIKLFCNACFFIAIPISAMFHNASFHFFNNWIHPKPCQITTCILVFWLGWMYKWLDGDLVRNFTNLCEKLFQLNIVIFTIDYVKQNIILVGNWNCLRNVVDIKVAW